MLASVHEHTELILDSFWNVKPMELGVHETRQTVVDSHVRWTLNDSEEANRRSLQAPKQLIGEIRRRENAFQYSKTALLDTTDCTCLAEILNIE